MNQKIQALLAKLKPWLARAGVILLAVWLWMKKQPKTAIAIGVVLFIIFLFTWWIRSSNGEEYITDTVVRGDLRQVVEAVGEVISERDLKLQFPITGVVEKVHIEEGDEVEAGMELARLRSSGLAADVNSAAAQVAAARAELALLEEGTRPEQLVISEASLANKRASLDAAKETLESSERNLIRSQEKLEALEEEARVSLQGFVATASSDISQHLSTAATASRVMDDIFEDLDLLDVMIKHEPHKYRLLRDRQKDAQQLLESALSLGRGIYDYRQALEALEQARVVVSQMADILNQTYSIVTSMPITPAFSNSDREDSKSDIATQRSNVQSALSSLDSSLKSLRDATANFDTRVVAEEAAVATLEGTRDKALADIQTFETSLRIEEAQLALDKAGSRQAEIDASRARLNQTYAQLQRANERFSDTIIYAPIDGVITQVNLKEGELLSTSFASDAAITMLGNVPYRIEMFISEIDIPKVSVTQSGAIELDAFQNQLMPLIVSEVDPAATVVDGVNKYRAKLDFTESTEGLKIGMTGDAEIYTDKRTDVLIIPGRSVFTNEDGEDVVRIMNRHHEIEERPVVIGMDGEAGDTEVVSGVEEGETVVVLIKK